LRVSDHPNQISSARLLAEVTRLLRPFWPLVLFATAIGILGGLATAWLLATINIGLRGGDGITEPVLLRFAGLCLLSVCGTTISGVANSIIGQKIIAALRKDISARILRAPIARLEAHRSYRLLSVLTADVDTVSGLTFNFSAHAIAFAITIGSFAYLLSLSPFVFLVSIVTLALGFMINLVSHRSWIRDYREVRIAQDELHKQYRAIIDGAKELKVSQPRRGRVFSLLLAGAADRIADLKCRAMRLHWIADAASSAVFFVMIGLLLVVRHRVGIDNGVISGAVIVLLYVKGPVQQIAGAVPVFDQARIAFARIAALSAEFDQHEPTMPLVPDIDMGEVTPKIRAIELRGATHTFPAAAGDVPFTVGPIDLTIHAGELLFIVGENGSGKTTLFKLLLGLYVPQRGSILLDGKEVTSESRDRYRQLFSTIFADYYLFDDLAYDALPEEAGSHLKRLGIAHKVRVADGHFSTTDLSTGQRKRLALVHAWLERRPILVTDEWAADQDPEFRRIFYENLLPEMKRQGRTLIVVSHDDRYFRVADRVIRMAEGRIVEDRPMSEQTAIAGAITIPRGTGQNMSA
jgi:putative pyoverdin transport system ATP-binding/permease protein